MPIIRSILDTLTLRYIQRGAWICSPIRPRVIQIYREYMAPLIRIIRITA